jgi:hypothetical protein
LRLSAGSAAMTAMLAMNCTFMTTSSLNDMRAGS